MQGGRIGPPTWGTTPVTIGQVCMSPAREAGGIAISSRCYDVAIESRKEFGKLPLHSSPITRGTQLNSG